MSMNNNTNMRAQALAGTISLEQDRHRTYLAVYASGGTVDITISSGATFTIAAESWWGPQPAPMNDIVITGNGVVITG
jgi:hypothetical protein